MQINYDEHQIENLHFNATIQKLRVEEETFDKNLKKQKHQLTIKPVILYFMKKNLKH